MSEQLVNTIANLTLAEYKAMESKISDLQIQLSDKQSIIEARNAQLAVERERRANAEDEANKNLSIVSVRQDLDSIFSRSCYGVKLHKESPELAEMIKKSIDNTMEETINSQKKEITLLNDEIADLKKTATKKEANLIEMHNETFAEMQKTLNKEIKELRESLDTLTKDYEDLKLDKAAAIVEAERLAEVNKLKEEIEYIKASKEVDDYVWPKGPISALFKKQIREAARNLFDHYRNRKYFSQVTTTSAVGKAKDYLKTIKNSDEYSLPKRQYTSLSSSSMFFGLNWL